MLRTSLTIGSWIKMQNINELLRARNILLRCADALTGEGFTRVPNHMLKSEKLPVRYRPIRCCCPTRGRMTTAFPAKSGMPRT
jgi:hypothetical protein